MSTEEVWRARFDRERHARREAEALLHEKSRELYQLHQQAEARADDLAASLAALESAKNALVEREKMAALGSLVAGVAHEINTPMGAAVTAVSHGEDQLRHLSELVESGRLTRGELRAIVAELQDSLGLAARNLQRGAALVSSFKNVAVDQTSAVERRVRIRALADDVAASLGATVRRAGAGVVVDIPAGLTVRIDAGALIQVLTNLVQNACVHAFDGWEGERRITLSGQIEGGTLHLEVADTGRGMDADTAARVFEPFFTTRRGEGGTGLGLHVSHNLVTARLHGTLTLATSPGAGSRWRLALPVPGPTRTEPA